MTDPVARLTRRLERERIAHQHAEELLRGENKELSKSKRALESTLATYQNTLTEIADVFLKVGDNHSQNVQHLITDLHSRIDSQGVGYFPLHLDENEIPCQTCPETFEKPDFTTTDPNGSEIVFIEDTEGFSCAVSPVLSEQVLWGHLILRFPPRHQPTPLDQVLLELVSQAISVEVKKQHADIKSQLQEQKYRILFHTSIDGVLVHRLDGRITEASDSCVSMLGFSREHLRTMKITRLIAPETFAAAKSAFRQVRDTGYCHYEANFLRSDGSSFPAEIYGRLFKIDGESQIYGIVRDVTVRKRTQAAAVERDRKFRAVFESSLDGIILHDLEGCILDVNNSIERMFSIPREDLLGQQVNSLLPPGEAERVSGRIQEVLDKGQARFEIRFARPDGSCFLAEASGSVFELGGKQLIQGIIRDVTEQRAREEEARQARKEAEEANAAKSLFLATMSHEIRTPLNGILGFTDLLSQMNLDKEATEAINVICRSGNLLADLLNNLLDLSQIESGGLNLKRVQFDIRQLTLDVANSHKMRAKKKNILMETHISEEVPPQVIGDSTRTLQVISNLVGNAVKYTPKGQIWLKLESDNSRLFFTVKDNGPGFPPEFREKLFETFYQVDHSFTKKTGGAGLGLAVCREIVHAMGGAIQADAVPGEGATFHFWIPLQLPQADIPSPLRTPPPAARTGTTLLIVEDQEINARLLGIMLTKLGFRHENAENGKEALASLRKNNNFAAILMDVRMPVMDGLEASRRIRAGEGGNASRELPIIAVTANAMEEDQRACLDSGMDHFLSKPIRRQELNAVLSRIGLIEESFSI